MRIDRFLWFARIVRTRSLAQELAGRGHLRLGGRAIDKCATPVRIGDVLTFATPDGRIRAIRVAALPSRRGPAAEARLCYAELADDRAAANVSHQPPRD